MMLIFAVATAALRMQAFALGALERPPLPRMAATMLEQGPERPAAAALSVPPPRRLTDLLELEARGAPRKEGSLFTGRTRRVVRRVLGYVWPTGDWKGKILVCVSIFALCLAKWLNILVPFALKRASMVKVHPWQCPSLAPAPPHWAPSHCLGCSQPLPPPMPPISSPLTTQARRRRPRGALQAVGAWCPGRGGRHERGRAAAWRLRRGAAGRLTRQRGAH